MNIRRLKIRRLGYIDKGKVLVIFFNYKYYLFKGESRDWIVSMLRDGIIPKDIPVSFIDFLKELRLVTSKIDGKKNEKK